MNMKQSLALFPPSFYEQDPLDVAQGLLGAKLVHLHPQRGEISAMIVETEAYRGMEDKACHASKGITPRTAPMFGPPGFAYVYLIYGMYDMLNVTTWPEGEPAAVLIRALEPLSGIHRSTDGPGKLTKAMEITREHNTLPFSGPTLFLHPGNPVSKSDIIASPRIGVDYAGEWAKKPWRFSIRNHPCVSRPPKNTAPSR